MWKFNKKLARLTYRLYSSSSPSSPLHGKKKLPQNLKFVVLNPAQSGLVKNDQKQPRHRPSKKRSHKETGDNNLDFGSKLLVFEKQNSLDSALNSIRLKKPTSASLPSLGIQCPSPIAYIKLQSLPTARVHLHTSARLLFTSDALEEKQAVPIYN
ncbi:CIC_collapsed_G0037630.mRNA.1.CDS.1 [Saccharomyces cerevisiae]|nr:CIC_collapsed_G0037630.mRNA.1.CDS.1 [Saccharomyces cerevisiae]